MGIPETITKVFTRHDSIPNELISWHGSYYFTGIEQGLEGILFVHYINVKPDNSGNVLIGNKCSSDTEQGITLDE